MALYIYLHHEYEVLPFIKPCNTFYVSQKEKKFHIFFLNCFSINVWKIICEVCLFMKNYKIVYCINIYRLLNIILSILTMAGLPGMEAIGGIYLKILRIIVLMKKLKDFFNSHKFFQSNFF